MAAQYAIGIDLGGTNIKAGLCDQTGALRCQRSIATEAQHGPAHVLDRMAALVEELVTAAGLRENNIVGLGVGAPGPLDLAAGLVLNAPNLPGWVDTPVRERLAATTGLPVVLENDANAAAFGEFVAGAGRNVNSMVLLTLGTGIGGGIVLNGELWHGSDGAAAEIGHTVIVPGGRACPCGQAGCFERYASANALSERFTAAVRSGESSQLQAEIDAGRSPDAREIGAAMAAGDALAAQMWDETCYYLALGCINLEHVLSPDQIVLGGGLTNAGARLIDPVRAHFRQHRWKLTPGQVEIVLARLGTEAGIMGAAALAQRAATRS